MANFPGSLDSYTDPGATDPLNSPSHSGQHADKNAAIVAIETKVGVDASAVTTTHDYYIQHGVVPKEHSWQGVISPTALAATTNNWSPTGLSTAAVIRITLTGNQDLTGISNTGVVSGRLFILHNVDSADTLTLKDTSGSSSAGNQFFLNADVTLAPDQSCMIQYDSTSQCWRVVGGTGGGIIAHSSLSGLTTGDDHTQYLKEADINAKGDLYVGTANDTVGILSVGTDGQVLTADAASSGGMKWNTQSTTATRSIFIKPFEIELDDATRSNVGTTPDLIGDIVFADAARQGAYVIFENPTDWASGALTIYSWWSDNVGSNVVRTAFTVTEIQGGDAPGETGVETDTDLTVSDTNVHRSQTCTITPSTASALIKLNIERLGNHANDTNTGNWRLHAIEVSYTATGLTGPAGPAGTSSGNLVQWIYFQ